MKKWIICLLLGAMLTGLTACGGGEPAEPSSGAETPAVSDTVTEEAEEPAEETENPAEIDELPTTKEYEGHTFTILSHELPDSSVAWKVVDIYTRTRRTSAHWWFRDICSI